MHDPQALISTEQLAGSLSPARSQDLRLHDLSGADAGRQRGSLHRRVGPPHLRGGTYSGRRLPRPARRVLRHDDAAALHDAADGAARGGVRPARARRKLARRALQHRQHDVGDALLVDAARARLRPGGGPGRRLRQVEGRGQAHRKRSWQGLCADHVHGQPAAGAVRRQGGCAFGARRSGHRHRQCARPAVSQRPGAEPLRPAGPRPRQRQRAGREPRRPRDQGIHDA